MYNALYFIFLLQTNTITNQTWRSHVLGMTSNIAIHWRD